MSELHRTPIFRALTQPQMFAGVTYSFFIINGIVTTEAFLVTHSFWALVIAAAASKVAAAPFHFWAPDVYQGAPTPVTAKAPAAAGEIVVTVDDKGYHPDTVYAPPGKPQ